MNQIKRILIAYDGSSYADNALLDLRRAGVSHEAEALIVTVSEGLVSAPTPVVEVAGTALAPRRVTSAFGAATDQALRLLAEARGFATAARDRVRSHFVDWNVDIKVLEGSPSRKLLAEAEQWQPDLIVVGSQGHSAFNRFILGSVSKNLATRSPSSVRVVRRKAEKDHDEPPRILIAVDGSPDAELAVRSVGSRVWPDQTEVRIVGLENNVTPSMIEHIFSSEAAIRDRHNEATTKALAMMEWAADELRAIGLKVSVAVRKGDPQSSLIDEARKWEADSIFIGAYGLDHRGEQSGLGRVAAGLVTKAPCTVEIVRRGYGPINWIKPSSNGNHNPQLN